jgi:hypothetical protein
MLVDPPALVITEIMKNNGGRSVYESGAVFVWLALGQEDACVTESNNISATSLPNIDHVTDVFIDAPTSVVREIVKLGHECIERVCIPLPSRDADICVGERDEIIETVASGICKESDMFVVRIERRVREVGKGSVYLAAEAPERDTTVRLETDDVGAT